MEPLIYLAPEYWCELQNTFRNDWPTNISGYYILEIQKQWIERGLGYGFKVYCPFGKVENGMVAINIKNGFYEVVIQCGTDTAKLEEALIKTKIINWTGKVTVPYAPMHIIKCVQKIIPVTGCQIHKIHQCSSYIYEKTKPPFINIKNFPDNVRFDTLREEHVQTVNDWWPYKHSTSDWYFRKLIVSGAGYGIYENNNLACWVLINEGGSLCNLFTLEDYRRKGYAEIILKKVCNILLENKKDIFVFGVHGNTGACNLYKKMGFEQFSDVAWCFLKPKENELLIPLEQ